eukprot:353880-Chlamydomonas_euryale.AAC.10
MGRRFPSLLGWRPHGPPAATARQRPQRLPAPDHRHGQATRRHLAPNGSDVHSGGGTSADACPRRIATHA